MKAQNRPGRFKLAWFVAGVVVVPLSALLTILVLVASGALLNAIDRSWYAALPNYDMLNLAIFWLISGVLIGCLQKAIVKRYLRVELGRWTVYSALGALLAGAVAYPCLGGACLPAWLYDFNLSPDVAVSIEFSIVALIYLTVFSTAQCCGLPRRARGSIRWIAAHLGSQLLAMLALAGLLAAPGMAQFDAALTLGLSIVVVTAVSGFVMQRILTTSHADAGAANDDWAYQPVAINTAPPSEPSIKADSI